MRSKKGREFFVFLSREETREIVGKPSILVPALEEGVCLLHRRKSPPGERREVPSFLIPRNDGRGGSHPGVLLTGEKGVLGWDHRRVCYSTRKGRGKGRTSTR